MRYTKKEQKEQIKRSLSILFTEFDLNLKSFCEKFNYNYFTIYQKLTNNSIEHDLVNEMIHKLDKKRSLNMINSKLVISKLY